MIVLENISFAYEGRQVLENLSWQLEPGVRVVLQGGSGEGKTTLLFLLAGLALPQKGRLAGNTGRAACLMPSVPMGPKRAKAAVPQQRQRQMFCFLERR